MPYSLTWEAPTVFCVRFAGVLTPEDVRAVNEKIAADPRLDDARYAIVDLTNATEHTFDLSNPGQLVEPHAQLFGAAVSNPRLRVVFAAGKPGLRGLARRVVELGWPFPAHFVDTVDEAREWLAGQTQSLHVTH